LALPTSSEFRPCPRGARWPPAPLSQAIVTASQLGELVWVSGAIGLALNHDGLGTAGYRKAACTRSTRSSVYDRLRNKPSRCPELPCWYS
jgi:hypothetical protein